MVFLFRITNVINSILGFYAIFHSPVSTFHFTEGLTHHLALCFSLNVIILVGKIVVVVIAIVVVVVVVVEIVVPT